MADKNKSIHEFDLELICDYFSTLERQGPGSPEITIKALSFIDNLNEESLIADIGCGTGGQTMILAQHVKGKITGLDLFPVFIDLFNNNVKKLNLQDKVKGIIGSMDDLPFNEESLDLIWSEGAIYNIGFERGLNEWRKFLKSDGYIAVSEVSWFTEEHPAEINEFWEDAYPEIDTIPNKVVQIQKAGYVPVWYVMSIVDTKFFMLLLQSVCNIPARKLRGIYSQACYVFSDDYIQVQYIL